MVLVQALGAIYSAFHSDRNIQMNRSELEREIISTYRKHGWQLRRVLLSPERRAEILGQENNLWEGIRIDEAPIDALWFSRPSHENREAWELRLLAESPYALFETFEPDEDEELREEARLDMEARMCVTVLSAEF